MIPRMDTITFHAASDEAPQFTVIKGSHQTPSMIMFKNAVLARAETNKNRDRISPQGIAELASTIAGWPIDIEHNTQDICGVFSGGRASKDGMALLVDGALWADRYPDEAQGVMESTYGLSIEATAEAATCSECGQTFTSSADYCAHLTGRRSSGATRVLSGLKSRGGAITRRPAGTATQFSPSEVFMVASHTEKQEDPKDEEKEDKKESPEQERKEPPMEKKDGEDEKDGEKKSEKKSEMKGAWYDAELKKRGETLKDLPDSDFADPSGRRFPYKIHGTVNEEGWKAAWSAAHGGHTGSADNAAISRLKRDKPEGVDIKESEDMDEQLKVELSQALAKIATLEASAKTLGDENATLRASLTDYQAKDRRNKLGASIDEETWTKQKDLIMAMPEPVFDLMASAMTKPVAAPDPKPATPANPVAGSFAVTTPAQSGDRLVLK